MMLYRIVKSLTRTQDLTGTGAFKAGGRWNSKGTYMLYTSETSSLALLETLVHTDETEWPPRFFVIELELSDKASIYTLPDDQYPDSWTVPENPANKKLGDLWMKTEQLLAVRVRSVINPLEFNYLLNPSHADYHRMMKVSSVIELLPDQRLKKQ